MILTCLQLIFFTKFKTIWDEIDHLNPLPTCSCDDCSCNPTQQLYKFQKNERLTHFLMKLDSKYTQVRTTILMILELPTIAQAYQILNQEQRHQTLSKLNDSSCVSSFQC